MKKYLVMAALSIFCAMPLCAQTNRAYVKKGVVNPKVVTSQTGPVSKVQKTGYVNTETILEALPEYKVAKEKLEALNKQYKAKVDNEYSAIEKLYNSYQQQKSALNSTQRQMKENEIIEKEKAAKDLQKSYFGQDGTMQKKSDELLGPVRDKVQKAINAVAQEGDFMIIFDVSSLKGVVYTNAESDLSSVVISRLNAQ
ncbi:MAG: OmpH family outer membrane protein [Bacteroidales bacterium]|jgi:outer membrane protein|nr:OmpH family outer membrane protein [Bacteroidales bacterium]MCI1733918.1 OmpH family outer membrane protein [Bacteroidales bacterium]